MPCGLARIEQGEGELVLKRRRVRQGEVLYAEGDACPGIYVVRAGALKTSICAPDGLEQVTGFPVAGEVVGIEGWPGGQHLSRAVALEDTEVAILSCRCGPACSQPAFPLQRVVSRLLGREIVRAQQRLLLAVRPADERLAGFLLDLSRRMRARGYSGTEFVLRMTRRELGEHLGLKLETVSRALHSLQDRRLLQVDGRHVRIADLDVLRAAFPAVAD